MLSLTDIRLQTLATHYVGNPAAGDVLQLSSRPVPIENEGLHRLLLSFFLTPFKEAASYRLWHPAELSLNEIFNFVSAIFENPKNLLRQSVKMARHLHDITNLPQIKSGELHVAYFQGCPLEGKLVDAVGIYKTESKSAFLKIEEQDGSFAFQPDEGISPEKLDKGCLIFNTDAAAGYRCYVTDRTAKGGEAQFWKDHFLKVRAADDAYHATEDYLHMSRLFIQQQIPEEYEVERVQQIEMLNRSTGYFQQKEAFQKAEFEQAVFRDETLIRSFRQYEQQYAEDRELRFNEQFEISTAAVKKNLRGMRSVLKLDKNFHVYVHGDRGRIERGYDEAQGLHFYKIFFEEES